jgi:hypothetical protein
MAVGQSTVYDEVLDFLASGPTLEQILQFKASPTIQQRLRDLLDANRAGRLTPDERSDLDTFEQIDQVIALLKVRARQRLAE